MSKKELGNLRLSQIFTQYGPGAIVDLRGVSVLPLVFDEWIKEKKMDGKIENYIIKDKNLIGRLRGRFPNLRDFVQFKPELKYDPEKQMVSPKNQSYYSIIFPEWGVCNNCKRLDTFENLRLRMENGKRLFHNNLPYSCKNCFNENGNKEFLIPARLVIACGNGHLDDFPWKKFAHDGEPCMGRGKKGGSDLKLIVLGKSSQLADLKVSCTNCGAGSTLNKAFEHNSMLSNMFCQTRRPELRDYDRNRYENYMCKSKVRALLRGATNLHFPELISALSIPHKNKANIDLNRQNLLFKLIDDEKEDGGVFEINDEETISFFNMTLKRRGFDEVTKDQLKEMLTDKKDENLILDIRREEYEYLISKYNEMGGDANYSAKLYKLKEDRVENKIFSKVVIVEKVKELMVMTGFSRINPINPLNKLIGLKSEKEVVSLSITENENYLEYLPGVENWGEGIFFVFKSNILDLWRTKFNIDRVRKLSRENEDVNNPFSTPLFVLAHSFAHALLKSLSKVAGYSVSSLRERMYVLPDEGNKKFLPAIFIYTASSDTEGSLGGLTNVISEGNLSNILSDIYETNMWCSSDPICIETKKPDESFNNLSACHACLFIPETSCEFRNEYLDRGLLVGSTDERKYGLLSRLF